MTDVKKLITEHLDIWLTAESKKKSGRGRSSGSSNSIYGIKKLRELIMELAIQGKLVKPNIQDSNVEDLIWKIQQHKEILFSQNKKLKSLQSKKITDKDLPFKIPNHWKWMRFGEVSINRDAERIPLSTTVRETKKGEYDYYGASGVIDHIDDYLFDKTLLLIGEDGANLLSRSTPIAFFATGRYWVNNHAHVIDGCSEDFLNYLKLFINAIDLSPYVTGTAQPKMNQAKMNDILIALPPIEEQQRIVAKVDELMQLCDQLQEQQNLSSEAHDQLVDTFLNILINSDDVDEFQQNWRRISDSFDLLFTTEYSVEQLKQTISKLAVMGTLVKPEAMDETTKLEIHQHKINFSKKNSEANFVNFHGLNELKNSFSNNMEIFRLGDIADIVRGGSPRPAGDLRFYEGNIPFLKVADITRSKGKFVEGHTSTIKEAGLHKTRFIDSRTVLLTNSGATLGVPAICDFPTTFNDGVAAFINLSNHVFDEYLYLYLSTLTKWFLNVAAQGQGQPNLNTDIVKSTWIALPTRKVQKDIVDMVDNLFSIIDRLQTLQSKLRKTKLHLADSLVSNALSNLNDKRESEAIDNIVLFEKQIETVKQSSQKVTDQIDLFTDESVDDDVKLLSLAAEITFQLHTEPTFGHLKLQKLIYLCQQLKHMDLAADFKQHAAGPYDPVIARYLDKEFKVREWFSYDPKRDLKYKPLSRCNDHRSAFNRYFAKDVSEIYDLIGLFRTSKSDHIEIVATLFACWLRLLKKKLFVTEEQLLKDFYAWSEEKNRFSKAEVLNGYKWMKMHSITPIR